jgi:hypothetical protein
MPKTKAKEKEPKPEIEHTPAANQQNALFVPVTAFCVDYEVAKKNMRKERSRMKSSLMKSFKTSTIRD